MRYVIGELGFGWAILAERALLLESLQRAAAHFDSVILELLDNSLRLQERVVRNRESSRARRMSIPLAPEDVDDLGVSERVPALRGDPALEVDRVAIR